MTQGGGLLLSLTLLALTVSVALTEVRIHSIDDQVEEGQDCTCKNLVYLHYVPNASFKSYARTSAATLQQCYNQEIRCLYRIQGADGQFTRLVLDEINLEARDELNVYHEVATVNGTVLVPYML